MMSLDADAQRRLLASLQTLHEAVYERLQIRFPIKPKEDA
jgi:hypothetical protein